MRRLNLALTSPELSYVREDIRRLFEEFERTLSGTGVYSSGECTPPLDVFETEQRLEVRMDVPGVQVDTIRVLFKHGVLVIAGAKPQLGVAVPGATFHLVEREFGRFARAVRLSGAVDIGKARARLVDGELRIEVPKIAERRGQELRIRVERGSTDRGAPR